MLWPMQVRRAVGVDLAAGAVHVVVVEDGRVVDGAVVEDPSGVVAVCAGADRIGIDAPAAPSLGVHAGDAAALPKLRAGRCGELAAAEQLGVWVAFVTGASGACPAWMETGFAVWSALRDAGHDPIEVYPAGSVWLQERRWPPRKTTPAGLAARRALLAGHLELPPFVELWSHDSIDAAIAAAVAAQGERAVRAGHDDPGCDGSAIWFLSPPAARPPGA